MENFQKKDYNLAIKPKKPRFLVKALLEFLCNFRQEDSISDWIKNSVKKLIVWVINVIVTGSLVLISLLPVSYILRFYTGFLVPVSFIPVMIVSFGLTWNAWEKLSEKRTELKIRENLALPKMYLGREK